MNSEGGRLIPFPEHEAVSGELVDADGDDIPDTTHAATPGAEIVERPEADPVPLEGELVDEPRPAAAVVRRVIVAPAVRIVRHDRTTGVARGTMRHLAYAAKGASVIVRRWRDTHGAGRYERQMRAAEAAGDQEALRYWQEQDVAEKQRRHQRVMDWVESPVKLAKAAGIVIASLAGLLLAVGIVLAVRAGDAHLVIVPIGKVLNAIAFVWWFLTAYGLFLLVGATAVAVAYLYQQGRQHADMPRWLNPPEPGDPDVMDDLPDEGTILNAIKNLNIAGFNRAVKDGWRIKFLMPPTIDGKGWRAQLALPPACPVEEIVKRKTTLAHNLVRFPIEVWPTEPQPAVLDLWVAQPGALSGPIDPWPLLDQLQKARTDYFTGVPVGVTIRGDVVRGRLFEANYVMGGVMGSGKSTMAITLTLGAMLDPLVDIDVVVMAENADYEPMLPRLRSLHTGSGDETVEWSMLLLEELFRETTIRGQALKEHDKRAATRELAEKDERLRPRIVVFDECQNLFLSEHGATALTRAVKVQSTARKYGITLLWLTPDPTKDSLPRKLIATASNKACYAIGDQLGNDAVLGTGSYKAGISAVGLVPKTDEGPGDVGTCMARGFMPKPGLLRTFYVPQDDAHRATARALELRAGHDAKASARRERQRDLLADVLGVLGGEDVRAPQVARRLQDLSPAYAGLSGEALAERLRHEFEVPVRLKDGSPMVRVREVQAATSRRENDPDRG